LLWKFGIGTVVALGAWVNVVDNYYSKASGAIKVDSRSKLYARGNVVPGTRIDINRVGRQSVPFPAPPVDTTDAATAACLVRLGAGVRPLDAIDEALVTPIVLPGCAG